MNRTMPGLPGYHQHLAFTQTRVHQVSDTIQPSHPLLPLLLLPSIPPSIRVFSNESALRMRWPKYWSFSFSIIPSKEIPGPVGSPCSPRDSQESSPTPQFKSINSSVFSFLYSPTLTSIHDHWKNHSLDLTWRTFVGKVISLLLNMLRICNSLKIIIVKIYKSLIIPLHMIYLI